MNNSNDIASLIGRVEAAGETAIEAQRELARSMFPQEWAATLSLPGEKRRRRQANLRRQAIYEQRLAPLRAAGKTCASCDNFRRRGMGGGHICLAESDFHGDMLTTPDNLCADWRGAVEARALLPQKESTDAQ